MTALYHLLGTPFGWIMKIIYDFCQNYGVAIILFTLFTKLILFPITYKQMKSTSKMQLLSPKLEKLRKSYQNNPQKLQEEQMKLYQEEHINPMGSCLPMILQFIILFGVLDVVYRPLTHIMKYSSSIVNAAVTVLTDAGMKNVNGLREELQILSASMNDKYIDVLGNVQNINISKLNDFYDKFQIFGIHLGEQPTFKPDTWNYESIALFLIPFIAGALQLILTLIGQRNQKKTNADAAAQMRGMNLMMYIMPLFSIWFAFMVPAGVGFYWICSSFFSLIQTIALNKWFTTERIEAIAAKDKEKLIAREKSGKKSLMQNVMERANAEANNMDQYRKDSEQQRGGMSRKELNVYNRKKIDEARAKLSEKYKDTEPSSNAEADEFANDPVVIAARKRMAEKYGDRYED